MPRYAMMIKQPGDRADLPWLVRFVRADTGDTFEYRTRGDADTIRAALVAATDWARSYSS